MCFAWKFRQGSSGWRLMLEDRYALLWPNMAWLRRLGYRNLRELLLAADGRPFCAWLLIEWIRDTVEYVLQSRHCRNSLGRLLKCVWLLLLDGGQILLPAVGGLSQADDCRIILAWAKEIGGVA